MAINFRAFVYNPTENYPRYCSYDVSKTDEGILLKDSSFLYIYSFNRSSSDAFGYQTIPYDLSGIPSQRYYVCFEFSDALNDLAVYSTSYITEQRYIAFGTGYNDGIDYVVKPHPFTANRTVLHSSTDHYLYGSITCQLLLLPPFYTISSNCYILNVSSSSFTVLNPYVPPTPPAGSVDRLSRANLDANSNLILKKQ